MNRICAQQGLLAPYYSVLAPVPMLDSSFSLRGFPHVLHASILDILASASSCVSFGASDSSSAPSFSTIPAGQACFSLNSLHPANYLHVGSVVDQLHPPAPPSSRGNLLDKIFSTKPQPCQAHRGKYGLRGALRSDHFVFPVLSLNIRSLAEKGKISFLAKKLKSMEVDVACVQETRLRDTVTMDRVGECSTYFTPAS
eukprot:3254212-Amphidinium_carterae.1